MSLRPPLRVSTFQSRTVVSMFGRLCHLFVHALSSLQVANAQCMTLRSLAPCLRAAREKHRFAAGKKHRNGKKRVWQQEKNALQREKAVSAAGKNASKKCRFAARKIQSSRKNTLQQHKSTFAAEKMHFGGSGKKPSEAGKNPSEERKKPAEAGKKPAAEKVQLCNPKSCRNGKNTFPQREKAAAHCRQTLKLKCLAAECLVVLLVLAVVSVCIGDVVTGWTVYRSYTRSLLDSLRASSDKIGTIQRTAVLFCVVVFCLLCVGGCAFGWCLVFFIFGGDFITAFWPVTVHF